MNQLTKKLMENEKVWSRLSPEERACFKKAGKENCVFWNGEKWDKGSPYVRIFSPASLYRIARDYQPEPEIERCEVKVDRGKFIVYKREGKHEFCLTEALNDPDFIKAVDENGSTVPIRAFVLNDEAPAPWPHELLFRSKK